MILFPAIDLKDGVCVRLQQGDMARATVFHRDPAAQALAFEAQGFRYLHLVDLDGAFAGKPVNAAAVERILDAISIPLQLGGGVRDMATVEGWLGKGVTRVIIGTAAVRDPALVKEAARRFPGRIAVGLDARDGKVAVEGWAETSELTVLDIAKRFEDAGVAAIIYTDIDRDGALTGLNIEATVDHVSAVGNGADGIHVTSGILTADNASRNGGTGANMGLNTAYSGCRFASNSTSSMVGGKAVGGNLCDDGRCSTTGGSRYYLTFTAFDGAHAGTACSSGFHMASAYELLDPTAIHYDKTLGRITLDQGGGPPSGQVSSSLVLAGWIRTGADPDGGATPPSGGRSNCNAWTSTSGSGTVAAFSTPWTIFPSVPVLSEVSPLESTTFSCSSALAVWCMED